MRNKQVEMILDGPGSQQRAGEIPDNTADVGVQFVADLRGQNAFPVLCGEDDVDKDLGERLRHGVGGVRPFRASLFVIAHPERCPGLSPFCPLGQGIPRAEQPYSGRCLPGMVQRDRAGFRGVGCGRQLEGGSREGWSGQLLAANTRTYYECPIVRPRCGSGDDGFDVGIDRHQKATAPAIADRGG